MMNFFKNLFGHSVAERPLRERQKQLLDAVENKDVATTYKLLSSGISPNFIYRSEPNEDGNSWSRCPHSIAQEHPYQPMLRLLDHFNAKPFAEILAIEKEQCRLNEIEKKRQKEIREAEKKKAEELQAALDNKFLDEVLK